MMIKERIKCILVMLTIALVLLLLFIPFLFVEEGFHKILQVIIVENYMV